MESISDTNIASLARSNLIRPAALIGALRRRDDKRGIAASDWGAQIGDEIAGYDERWEVGLHFIQPNLPRWKNGDKTRRQWTARLIPFFKISWLGGVS